MKKTILIGFILFAIVFPVNAQVVQSGLVGHFPLEGNGNDISTTNIDGTATNITLTSGCSGQANTASAFSPSQNSGIDAGTNNRTITNQVTVSAWVKTTNTNTQAIVNKFHWPTDAGYYIEVYQNKAIIAGRDGGGSFIYPGLGTTTITDGQWHHIVGVVNNNVWQIWVDCNLENSTTSGTSSPNIASSINLAIGYYYYGSTTGDPRHFDGSIDEVRIYNRALNATEIDSLCQTSTHVAENKFENTLSLFPNPSSDFIHFMLSNTQQYYETAITIHNSLGQVVYTGAFSTTLNVSGFARGLYYVTLTDERKNIIATGKFTKG